MHGCTGAVAKSGAAGAANQANLGKNKRGIRIPTVITKSRQKSQLATLKPAKSLTRPIHTQHFSLISVSPPYCPTRLRRDFALLRSSSSRRAYLLHPFISPKPQPPDDADIGCWPRPDHVLLQNPTVIASDDIDSSSIRPPWPTTTRSRTSRPSSLCRRYARALKT